MFSRRVQITMHSATLTAAMAALCFFLTGSLQAQEDTVVVATENNDDVAVPAAAQSNTDKAASLPAQPSAKTPTKPKAKSAGKSAEKTAKPSASQPAQAPAAHQDPAVAQEVERRLNIASTARDTMRDGAQLFAAGDYASAADRYRYVVENLPRSPKTDADYAQAISGLIASDLQVADKAAEAKQWEEARRASAEVIKYDPTNKLAQDKLLAAEVALGTKTDLPYYERDKLMTPEFVSAINRVRELQFEGDGLRDSGQYDIAENRYKQILAIDPYNVLATESLRRLTQLKNKYYKDAKRQGREEMLYQVEQAWSNPVPRDILAKQQQQASQIPEAMTRIAGIEEKLDKTMIDKVKYEEATIDDVINDLRRRIRAADPQGDGVNIILKNFTTNAEGAVEAVQSRPITLELANLPASELLRLALQQADMTFKVEEFAIVVRPLTDTSETLYIREFKVPAGMFNIPAGNDITQQRDAVKSALSGMGIEIADSRGDTVNFYSRDSRLVVRSTLDNLDLLAMNIEQSSQTQPQVQIETKFMEVNQNDLDELSFRWMINRRSDYKHFDSDGNVGTQRMPTDTPGLRSSVPVNATSFDVPGQLAGDLGVPNGGGAITANALDGIMSSLSSIGGPWGTVMQTVFSLSKWKFEMLVNAISQKTGTDLLSAPKVVTASDKQAEIKIVREFYYPDFNSIEPPQVPDAISFLPGIGDFRPVTPSTPTAFLKEDVGVSLNVTPQVNTGNTTVTMTLEPKVVEFEGFINYGSPIETIGAGGQRVLLSENIINTPVFNRREVTTKLTVADQQTVLIAGLLRDDRQKVDDKLPILGDLPMVGRLFRSKIEQTIKKNLLVFVTPTLLDNKGQPFNSRILDDGQRFANTPNFPDYPSMAPGFEDLPLYQPVVEEVADGKVLQEMGTK